MDNAKPGDALSAVGKSGTGETAAEEQLLREVVLSRMQRGTISREGLDRLVGGEAAALEDEKNVAEELRERAGDRLP